MSCIGAVGHVGMGWGGVGHVGVGWGWSCRGQTYVLPMT